jgi:hypothetical protein
MTAEERWALTKFPADVYQYHVDLFPTDLRSGPIRSLPYILKAKQLYCTLAFQKKSE